MRQAITMLQASGSSPGKVEPPLPLTAYSGSYADPWFGTITVSERDGKMLVTFPHWPGIKADVAHWTRDTFQVRFNDPSVEPVLMTFQIGAEGKVERVKMRAVSPLARFDYRDLEFTPVAASAPAG